MDIYRLHELTEKQVRAAAAFLRAETKCDQPELGSTWVCAAIQKPHWYADDYLLAKAKIEGPDSTYHMWVGFDGDDIVAVCKTLVEPDAVRLQTFVVDGARSQAEQVQMGVEIALEATNIATVRPTVYVYCNENSMAADFARALGFKEVEEGKPMAVTENPIKRYECSSAKMREELVKLGNHLHGG